MVELTRKNAGWYHDTSIILYESEEETEFSIRCHFDWQPEEAQTRDYPGCGAEASIYNITSTDEGFDFDKVSDKTKADLENECYESMNPES